MCIMLPIFRSTEIPCPSCLHRIDHAQVQPARLTNAMIAGWHCPWRHGAESNRRSGFCRPLPYHLATVPREVRSPARTHTLNGGMPHQLRWEWRALIGWGGF